MRPAILCMILCATLLIGCSSAALQVDRADPRFRACGGNSDVMAAFRMVPADYRVHFPLMGRAPELEIEADAFTIVHGASWMPATFGLSPAEPADPGSRYICVYVGTPPDGHANVYGPIKIAGLAD